MRHKAKLEVKKGSLSFNHLTSKRCFTQIKKLKGNILDNLKNGIDELIKKVKLELEKKDLCSLQFDDFSDYFPDNFGSEYIKKSSLIYLAEVFGRSNLDSEPKIRSGNIERNRHSPIYIYLCDRSVSNYSQAYKHALLMLRVAIIMAVVDGSIEDNERDKLKSLIWGMKYLTLEEKRALNAKAHYLLSAEMYQEPKVREYMRLILSPSLLIEKLGNISDKSVKALLEIAMEVAVSDGRVEERELIFMKNIYRKLDMPVRSAKTDLKIFAKERFITLKDHLIVDSQVEREIYEVDDILGDLFSDYDEFY